MKKSLKVPSETWDTIQALAAECDLDAADVVRGCIEAVRRAGSTADGLRLTPYALAREWLETRDLFHRALTQLSLVSQALKRGGLSVEKVIRGVPRRSLSWLREEEESVSAEMKGRGVRRPPAPVVR